jgi:hypothetical protein
VWARGRPPGERLLVRLCKSFSGRGGLPGWPGRARGLPRPDPRRGSQGTVGGDLGLIQLGDLLPGARLQPGLLQGYRRGQSVTKFCHTLILGPQEVSRGR